jgi:multisubunit Na+/H+ antiporter MnhG subunit
MSDIIIGYGWGLFQMILGAALVVAGIVGLFRLRKPQYRHWVRCAVLL